MLVKNELDIASANSGVYLKVHSSLYNNNLTDIKFNLDHHYHQFHAQQQSKYMRFVVIKIMVFIMIGINDITAQRDHTLMKLISNPHFQTMVICYSFDSEILLPSEKDLYSEDVQH